MGLRRLPARTWFILFRALDRLLRGAGTRDAAQAAFFILLSVPATLLLLVWTFSTVLDDPTVQDRIIAAALVALPLTEDQGGKEVEALLQGVAAGAGTLGWVGAASLLYSASGAIGALRRAVNEAFGVTSDLPWAQSRMLDAAIILVAAPCLILGLGLNLASVIPAVLRAEPFLASTVGFVVTELLPLLLLFGVQAWLLRVLPAARASLRAALPGALAGTLGLLLVNRGADVYFALTGAATLIYGLLGTLLITGFLVYLNTTCLLLGAYVAAELSVLPNGPAIDAAIEAERSSAVPLGQWLRETGRGLFLRSPRGRRRR